MYSFVATLRYLSSIVEAAILRLTPQEATFEYTEAMTYDAIGNAIAKAGLLESDEARVVHVVGILRSALLRAGTGSTFISTNDCTI